uniref:hypothetical protein n=1 Tax=Streptomyces ruber TaxID=83378 RepID=UPI0027E4C8FD|nr:hypothetical protein [Streptomyces ruber]
MRHCLWRAVDQDGTVLGTPLQSKRAAEAAKRCMAVLMKKQQRTQGARHRRAPILRCRPQRVDVLGRSILSAWSRISPHSRPRRHRVTAPGHRTEMRRRFGTWNGMHRHYRHAHRGWNQRRTPGPAHFGTPSRKRTPTSRRCPRPFHRPPRLRTKERCPCESP